MSTLVTAYYEISSKKSIEQYHEWIRTFMQLQCNMVIFTDKKSSEWLYKNFPETPSRKYYVLEISEFTTSQWDYKKDEVIDHEKWVGHSENLYKVWNEKPFFVGRAFSDNVFKSNMFVWCDIGCFRDTNMMKYFKDTFPHTEKLNHSKIQMLQIVPFTEEDKENIYENYDDRFRFVNRIGGTMFSVPKHLVNKFCEIHKHTIEEFNKRDLFKGKDQSLFAFEVLQNPVLFDLVHSKVPDYMSYCDWFYFHIAWSDITLNKEKLHIAIIGPGIMPIPPNGWGAIEILIWDYAKNLEKLGHKVSIINTPDTNEIVKQVEELKADVVHVQYENLFFVCEQIYKFTKLVGCTSHFGYLDQLNKWGSYLQTFISGIKQSRLNNVYNFVLSPSIKNVFKQFQVSDSKIVVTPNGANEELFQITEKPEFPDRSIYLAKIDYRKRQCFFQSIKDLYYAGNIADNRFNPYINYLGEWSKDYLYNNLTHYGNLVLLSDGEADPLVVKEAFIAGLGVVISQFSTANLDLSKKFITVIPENKVGDLDYVEEQIRKNREYSVAHRDEIREYGLTFSWSGIVKKYEEMIYFLLENLN
jgi:hypothetical protein